MSIYQSVCEEAARAAGKLLLEMQAGVKGREKGANDLVSEADLAAQITIRKILLGAFPTYSFLGEEDDSNARPALDTLSECCWVVDPLDGTTNYLHRLQNFAVSIALCQEGKVLCGTVYDPVMNEFFWAERGLGAWLNGEKIHTSGCEQASQALVAASLAPAVPRGSIEVKRMVEAIHQCQGMRRLGSAALNLSYVAAGRLDAYWATSVKAWDVAAGLLLVQEAGGTISQIDGGTLNLVKPELLVSATSSLHRELLPFLQ
jgi:myo-inositol-1(or 4)-monophosphatase